MKLINMKKAGKNVLGILTDRGVADASACAAPGAPVTMEEALAMGREKAVAALRAFERERLADSRTCTGYENVHKLR